MVSRGVDQKKNLPESIRQKLRNLAAERKLPVDEIFRYYAIERFLYRLSVSPHVDKFFLKGGLMLRVWDSEDHRATIDIDLLGRMPNQQDHIRLVIEDVARLPVDDDGMMYNTNGLILQKTQAGAEYQGVSARFSAHLTKTRIPVQIDIGFSDVIVPKATPINYPTLLDMPAPQLLGYTIETLVAEKLESIVKLGQFNTRMKDFYDLWTILCRDSLPIENLKDAIVRVFANRGTTMQHPATFSDAFASDPTNKQRWRAFLRGLGREKPELDQVVNQLEGKLSPYLEE